RQLVRSLCRCHGTQLLDRHRVRGRQLRRGHRAMDRDAAARRRLAAHHASPPCGDGDRRQRHCQHAGHSEPEAFQGHAGAFEPLRGRRELVGQARHRHRHRQQRPRHRAGPAFQRSRRDAGAAFADARHQHRAFGAACLCHLQRGHARGQRPDRDLDADAAGEEDTCDADGAVERARQGTARRSAPRRLQARFRRGRDRLAIQIFDTRRRLLLQCRLLQPDRRGRDQAQAIRRHRYVHRRRRADEGR
ncbi:hypothetical protein KXV85_001467, partial [Aspergillus fumigatus]